MIVTTDIGNILYRDCKAFGIDIVPDGETLTGELKSERIVIHTKRMKRTQSGLTNLKERLASCLMM